ncbi:MAG: hypothetical protein M1577_03645 [Chloroflexi bacterium]|nr:hypothetical protein [Chloroflexota bacterium]
MFGKSKEQKAAEAGSALLIKVPASAVVLVNLLSESLGISDSRTKWKVHTEVLGLLCHLVSRWAFEIGGPGFRAQLQDRVTLYTIDTTVDALWDASQADQQFDVEGWKQRMKEELLHNLNAAELEYAECKQLIGSKGQSWPYRDDNAIGRFVGNITRLSGDDDDLVRRLTVALMITRFVLDRSWIRPDIEDVWRNAR